MRRKAIGAERSLPRDHIRTEPNPKRRTACRNCLCIMESNKPEWTTVHGAVRCLLDGIRPPQPPGQRAEISRAPEAQIIIFYQELDLGVEDEPSLLDFCNDSGLVGTDVSEDPGA